MGFCSVFPKEKTIKIIIVIGKQMSEKSQKQSHIKRSHWILLKNTALYHFWLTHRCLFCSFFFPLKKTSQKSRRHIKKEGLRRSFTPASAPGRTADLCYTHPYNFSNYNFQQQRTHSPLQALDDVTSLRHFHKSNFLTSDLNLLHCNLTQCFSYSQQAL